MNLIVRYSCCTRCGNTIPWEDQHCTHCELLMDLEDQNKEMRQKKAEEFLTERNREGWRYGPDGFCCPDHGSGGEPLKLDHFKDFIVELDTAKFTIWCEHGYCRNYSILDLPVY